MGERISIFLISLAIIGFQLAIINLLSYSQWHHFAYLAVSIAMLGFGSSGVILSVGANFFRINAEKLLPWLFLATGLTMFISPLLINLPFVRFDTFLVFTSYVHLIRLLATCFILFIPFLLGATVIGLYFMIRGKQIPLLYAWNLAGSAAGGVILITLSTILLPMNLGAVFGFAAVVSGFIISQRVLHRLAGVFLTIIGLVVVFNQPKIPFTSEFKSISKTLLIPGSNVDKRIPLAQGSLEIVSSNNLRQVVGLSLNYSGKVPIADVVFLNGEWYCAFERGNVDTLFYYENLYQLPYMHSVSPRVLFLQPSSTFFTNQALQLNANHIAIVEPIKPVADSLRQYPKFEKRVDVVNAYPREFIINGSDLWDIISFPLIGSFGSAGLSAVQEQYLYTTNTIHKAFTMLSVNGMLVLSSHMDNPPRNSLKLASLAIESLKQFDLDPQEHIVALRSWNTLMIVIKQTPFSDQEIVRSKNFLMDMGFDMVFPPSSQDFNILSDSTFQSVFQALIFDDSLSIAKNYSFNLRPPTDNSPFFSQFMKINEIRHYIKWFGIEGVVFLELGYFIVLASLLVCLLLAVVAIAFPLLLSYKKRNLHLSVWIYFSLLGLGYMLLEVSLIQRSILTLGNPITASAVVISALLCFSAIGSFYSSKFSIKRVLKYVLILISLSIILLAIYGNSLSSMLISLPFFLRIILLVLSIAPMGVLMGMAFPLGMSYISEHLSDQIAIAWGVNGFFSVLAAPIATIIAVELGFVMVLALSAILYLLSVIAAALMLIK